MAALDHSYIFRGSIAQARQRQLEYVPVGWPGWAAKSKPDFRLQSSSIYGMMKKEITERNPQAAF